MEQHRAPRLCGWCRQHSFYPETSGRGMWLQLQGTGTAFVAAVAMLVSDNCNHVPSVTESLVYCPGLAEF